MIKNKSSVNQCGQIRGWKSCAKTTHRRTRRGRVGCAHPRRGDRRRGCRRTWTHSLSSIRQRGWPQLLISPIWQFWRVYSSEDRFNGLLCWFDPRLLWAGGGFTWTRHRRSQDVCLKLGRRMKHTGVQFCLWDFQILADLLQREWLRIRPWLSWRYSRMRWRQLRHCRRALHLPSLLR